MEEPSCRGKFPRAFETRAGDTRGHKARGQGIAGQGTRGDAINRPPGPCCLSSSSPTTVAYPHLQREDLQAEYVTHIQLI